MTETMGITPVDIKETVIEMANSLIEKGFVKAPKAKKAPKTKAAKNGAPAAAPAGAEEEQKVEEAPAPPSPKPIDADDDDEDLKKPAKINDEPKIEQVAA